MRLKNIKFQNYFLAYRKEIIIIIIIINNKRAELLEHIFSTVSSLIIT